MTVSDTVKDENGKLCIAVRAAKTAHILARLKALAVKLSLSSGGGRRFHSRTALKNIWLSISSWAKVCLVYLFIAADLRPPVVNMINIKTL